MIINNNLVTGFLIIIGCTSSSKMFDIFLSAQNYATFFYFDKIIKKIFFNKILCH